MQLLRSAATLAAFAFALSSTLAVAHGPAEHATQTVAEPTAATVEALTGTVHDVIVDDTTRGTSQRFVELELADGSLVALQGDPAQALVRGATVEVHGHRSGKTLYVEGSRALAAAAAPDTKALTEIDGTLAILHADDFANGQSSFVYEVHHASGSVHQLRLAATLPALEPGMKVRVHGRISADSATMTPDRITILSRQAAAAEDVATKAATANGVLVIMANFNNTTAPAFSTAQAQQVMTSNSDSVANFFRETSYGQQVMNVTVTPVWVTMNLAKPTTCGSADWRGIGTTADAAAKAYSALYDPASYNFVVYVFPRCPHADGADSHTSDTPTDPGSMARAPSRPRPLRTRWAITTACCTRPACAARHRSAAPARQANTAIRSARWATSARCITTRCRKRSSPGPVDVGEDAHQRIGDVHAESARGRRRDDLRSQDSGGGQSNVLARVPAADRLRQPPRCLSQQRRADPRVLSVRDAVLGLQPATATTPNSST